MARVSPAAIAIEDQLLAFLRAQALAVSTSSIVAWMDGTIEPLPRMSSSCSCGRTPGCARHPSSWSNVDATARLRRLERAGKVRRIVFAEIANQEGHYWEAVG